MNKHKLNTLNRVLIALGEKEADISIDCYGVIRQCFSIQSGIILPQWDLTKETLEEQPEETQRIINKLLMSENG